MTDIINLSKSVSEESGCNVIVSSLVQLKGYLNAKVSNVNNRLHDYCKNRMLTFFKHDSINAKADCNISGLHLNSKGLSLFNENFVIKGSKTVKTEVSKDSVTKLMVLLK